MIIFAVTKEPHGWAIRVGERMTTPYRRREDAIREANRLADAIRRHGPCTQVIIEDGEPSECVDMPTGRPQRGVLPNLEEASVASHR